MAGRKIVRSRRRDRKVFNKTLTSNRPLAHKGGYYK